MSKSRTEEIMLNYNESIQTLLRMKSKLELLVHELLDGNKKLIHSVTSRVKSADSLENKLKKKEYTRIGDITDLVGLRIVTFFEEDAKTIESILASQFEIDQKNSANKATLLQHDQFGYLSLHLVGQLKEDRLSLPEYNFFQNRKFEIQIRSLLQHAWAEMQHDLGYKSSFEVPLVFRRRFASASALLEMQDREFNELRKLLNQYESSLPTDIKSMPNSVLIDKPSFEAFVNESAIVKRLDDSLISLINGKPDNVINLINLEFLELMGITNIGNLESLLIKHESIILRVMDAWIKNEENRKIAEHLDNNVPRGTAIYYLYLIYILSVSGIENQIKLMRRAFEFSDSKFVLDLTDRLNAVASSLGLKQITFET